jgi:YesN/AraC family two-component response regulator
LGERKIQEEYFEQRCVASVFPCYIKNRLDRRTDMKIIDIAYEVGFKDVKFFYEVFKKLTGETPGGYRKS